LFTLLALTQKGRNEGLRPLALMQEGSRLAESRCGLTWHRL